ncbi:hypothetical protein PSHI8_05930 [Polynucleobacter sp. SHI8]|uniref:hypothetical protein n=1 Tax=unclassified Polynucleobacter TaxID=2640945 RepID=UPI002492D1EB|nr:MULTISPECIES: hypothetical protein [unclassified Polynucleobacter]BDW10511.1 hypothetical protein PSHI2_05930 [Polynucleobacter sp. SHI2]BDW12957.1 hypothetical protein PSHI8_05930 [Polynucleobacter sp. SHI8]
MTDAQPSEAIKASPIKNPAQNWLLMIGATLVVLLMIWGGMKIYSLSQQIKKIEAVLATNSQQLINFNQILGHALDVQAENVNSSPVGIKASLEIFEKLNTLSILVEQLPIRPFEQSPSSVVSQAKQVVEMNKTSVNAEMRWWARVGNYILDPLKNYFNQLVKIQVMDSSVTHLAMTDYSQKVLREEILVRLLTSRTLLLNGHIKQTSQEVMTVKNLVEKNFLLNDVNTQKVTEEIELILKNLQELDKNASPNRQEIGDKK